jgi:hypothetical protein
MSEPRRIGAIVFAFEDTKDMSKRDEEELCELFELLQKRYHYKWCRTMNPKWVRALADQMEKDWQKEPSIHNVTCAECDMPVYKNTQFCKKHRYTGGK